MAPRKLSDADKRDVIEIYRQPGETTSTIAKRYGVSTSTISRILKTQMPEDEYRALISQKRSAPSEKPVPVSEKPVIEAPKLVDEKPKPEKPIRRARKRSRANESAILPDADGQLTLLDTEDEPVVLSDELSSSQDDDVSAVATELLTDTSVGSDDDDLDEDLDDLDGDLDDDLDTDFDEDDDEFDEAGEPNLLGASVEIMPLSDAVFPRTCYLVVDRLSELITHPLKEFAELGEIPAQQESARTLPIFDNHRVARRFSRRNQRVIKVPDGQLITKATSYLQAKGITHLLIDGNIYSLLG
ncbi:helix-turn-helix domain-containing protein [Leptothoe spongobia]|uniref:Helix-turn-helix domain-containing protein n=1 Tax=Leptothoe spongobia TAU-MAC 1115 TaxID=1967444 RepID=A0A947GLF7_9CYAN|nr:helix-turn-helix domain-containing protein [Leptothoe spongobia]MBT9314996.1 helix-turn-helix domain-containing protein [Leptothoe spongobia TAU-MAC 1115]